MAFRELFIREASELEGNPNYSVWSFKLRNMLNREDVWKLIDPPAGTVAPTDPDELAALQVQKSKALSMIALSVRHNVIPYIADITDPVECWNVLKRLYANNTNSRKLMLRRKLTNLNLDEGGSMSDFLQTLKELISDFACTGEALADDEVVEHALMALPKSCESLVNTVMYRPALPSITELTGVLMQEDIRRELRRSKKGNCCSI